MRPFLLVLACLALGPLGCAALPQPTEADVTRAQRVYPEATLASLAENRRTYVRVCGGCHALHLPREFSSAKWLFFVDEMVVVQKVKLSGEQRKQIEEFLIVMAQPREETSR